MVRISSKAIILDQDIPIPSCYGSLPGLWLENNMGNFHTDRRMDIIGKVGIRLVCIPQFLQAVRFLPL
jgi:hypothetical protein